MRALFCLAAAIAAGGCSTSSGVLKLGPDTFTVHAEAKDVAGGEAESRRMVLSEAAKYCADRNLNLMVTSIKSGRVYPPPGGRAEATFRCLAEGDKDLRRPVYEEGADTIIKVK